MFAHYYTGKVNGQKQHLVTISATPAPRGTTYQVADKKAARALAAQHGAKPWNF
jgi:hypothetical protein